MFFRTLCPTVMLASVHSGVVYPSYGGQSVVKKKTKVEEEDKKNQGGPRKTDEDTKPVLTAPTPTPSEDEEEDKENRPSPAGGVNKRGEPRSKTGEVHRARYYGDNKLRSLPNRCLSPLVSGAQRDWSDLKAPRARSTSSPLPLRAITPSFNIQGDGYGRAPPPSAHREVPTSPFLAGSRRDHPKQRSLPLKITKPALTVKPNQKLSIAYRNDRFYWVTKEVETSKGY